MLHSVLWTMDSGSDGWRRYVALMLDAISVGDRRPLPPAATFGLRPSRATGRWRAALDRRCNPLHLQRRYLIVTYSRFARKLLAVRASQISQR